MLNQYIQDIKQQLLREDEYDPSTLISFGLGFCSMLGITLAIFSTWLWNFGIYLFLLSMFFMLEYVYNLKFHPKTCSWHSFCIDHSDAFQIFMIVALVEYILESLFLPSIKRNPLIIFPAAFVALAGQCTRTYAMYYAGSNFHHEVRQKRDPKHKLVTTGPYTYFRHPSYFGWFWWAIAMQTILMNPLCISAAAVASWKFFNERIQNEEEKMVQFFGSEYERYRENTYVGIPFIQDVQSAQR